MLRTSSWLGGIGWALIALLAACGDDDAAPAAERDGGMDAAAEASIPGNGDGDGDGDGDDNDAGSDERDGSIQDASPTDAAHDAAEPSTCDLAACPMPDLAGAAYSVDPPERCCAGDRCGIRRGDSACRALDEGSPDEDCPDANLSAVDGGVAPGCCRSDNTCGHFDQALGCHDLINDSWFAALKSCDGPPSELPDEPFACLRNESPCEHDWQCCRHYNYQTQCGVVPGSDASVCNTCPDC